MASSEGACIEQGVQVFRHLFSGSPGQFRIDSSLSGKLFEPFRAQYLEDGLVGAGIDTINVQ